MSIDNESPEQLRMRADWERDDDWGGDDSEAAKILTGPIREETRRQLEPERDTGNVLIAMGLMALSGLAMGLLLGALLWRA